MRALVFLVLLVGSAVLLGQDAPSSAREEFVRHTAPVLALEHLKVIDGTGAPLRLDQTIVISGGKIASISPSATAQLPGQAVRVDLTGRTAYPGIVGLHSHLFMFTYGQQTIANPRLYLAAGVTTAQTSGGVNIPADLAIKAAIDAGRAVGPHMLVTGPLMNQGVDGELPETTVKRLVAHGVTTIKLYTQATRAFAGAVIDAAHAAGVKAIIHPCAVTWREAVDLGIDSFAHGFSTATDFVARKKPDVCPAREQIHTSLVGLDADGREMRSLYRHLIERRVAVNSTLPVIESFTPNRQFWLPQVLPFMAPAVQQASVATITKQNASGNTLWMRMLRKEMEFERAFVRAGGLLTAGSDPTGPAMIAGHADQREIELLVEAGFTPVEAIKIATFNGAQYLDQLDRIGSLTPGKQADIVIVDGDPTERIEDVEKVEIVFKQGIGYDSGRLRDSVKGMVGRSQ